MMSVITSYFYEACVFYKGRQMIYKKKKWTAGESDNAFFVFS